MENVTQIADVMSMTVIAAPVRRSGAQGNRGSRA